MPIDTLSFAYEVVSSLTSENADNIPHDLHITDGVLVYGMFLEGARWDRQKQVLQDSFPMEMYSVCGRAL